MLPVSRLIATVITLFSALALPAVSASPASAMSVQPTQIEMVSTGQRARAQVSVTNDGATPMPVELVIESLSVDEKGATRTAAGGDSFLIFPPQALIAPGASQVFRLQWVGEPQMAKSESFIITVNQIPVAAPKGRSTVQIVMAMGVLVNIAPAAGTANLRIVDTAVATQNGKRHPAITVENPTNTHALLPDAKVKLTSGSWSRTLEHSDLGSGIGLVQPGKKRRFVLPMDLPANVQSIQASIQYAPARR